MGTGASKVVPLKTGASPVMWNLVPTAEEARKLFNKIDVSKNRLLSVTELTDEVSKYGKHIRAAWPNERIQAIFRRFDSDNSGQLTLSEFQAALHELHKENPGGAKLRRRARPLMTLLRSAPRPPPFYPYSGTAEERDQVSEVLDGRLYLTNWRGAEDREEVVERRGVTHVLSVGEEFANERPLEADGVTYWQVRSRAEIPRRER